MNHTLIIAAQERSWDLFQKEGIIEGNQRTSSVRGGGGGRHLPVSVCVCGHFVKKGGGTTTYTPNIIIRNGDGHYYNVSTTTPNPNFFPLSLHIFFSFFSGVVIFPFLFFFCLFTPSFKHYISSSLSFFPPPPPLSLFIFFVHCKHEKGKTGQGAHIHGKTNKFHGHCGDFSSKVGWGGVLVYTDRERGLFSFFFFILILVLCCHFFVMCLYIYKCQFVKLVFFVVTVMMMNDDWSLCHTNQFLLLLLLLLLTTQPPPPPTPPPPHPHPPLSLSLYTQKQQ